MNELRVSPVFAFGFPKDKTDELNRAQMELSMKLGSRREIMERLGKQNIDDLMREIDEDTVRSKLMENPFSEEDGMNFDEDEEDDEDNLGEEELEQV